MIGGLKFDDLVLSIVERYLIQCPLFEVSVKRDSTVSSLSLLAFFVILVYCQIFIFINIKEFLKI